MEAMEDTGATRPPRSGDPHGGAAGSAATGSTGGPGPGPATRPPAGPSVEPQAGGLVDRLQEAAMRGDRGGARAAARQLCASADPADWEALVTAEVRWDEEVNALTAAALA